MKRHERKYIITEQCFLDIKTSGFGVPRYGKQSSFYNQVVAAFDYDLGNEATLVCETTNDTLKVKITQISPTAVKII